MLITARHLAAALTHIGADVESALLELAAVAPSLDTKVRAALYWTSEPAKLRFIKDRDFTGYRYIETPPMTRETCAMHAVDQITRILDDTQVVQYLEGRFEEKLNALEVLVDPTL